MSTHLKTLPAWAFLSLAANGLLVLTTIALLLGKRQYSISSPLIHSATATRIAQSRPGTDSVPELGPRHQLNYQQWVELLGQEAEVAARQQPKHLTILAGDSLSLWFPNEMLPTERIWLNQGISGETSKGLLNRLELFDQTQPDAILVMIGINDLIRGIQDETILANQQLILRYLRRVHPQATIVVQSILPHSAQKVTWEGRDRLLAIPNRRIQKLNQQLQAIAEQENVVYLDLYPLFADTEGNLKTELSTDGLHLNSQGYGVWRNALIVLNQLILDSEDIKKAQLTQLTSK